MCFEFKLEYEIHTHIQRDKMNVLGIKFCVETFFFSFFFSNKVITENVQIIYNLIKYILSNFHLTNLN